MLKVSRAVALIAVVVALVAVRAAHATTLDYGKTANASAGNAYHKRAVAPGLGGTPRKKKGTLANNSKLPKQ